MIITDERIKEIINRYTFLYIESNPKTRALSIIKNARDLISALQELLALRKENVDLKQELDRVAPFLAVHGMGGYTIKYPKEE